MDLLLNADLDEDVIREYLQEGDMYIGFIDNKVACEVVVTKVNEDTCE